MARFRPIVAGRKAGTMFQTNLSKRILSTDSDDLRRWIDGFLVAKRAAGLARGTIEFYRVKLGEFVAFCKQSQITNLEVVDPTLIREWLISLATGHNPGGVSAYYRSLRAFLLWYEIEAAADGWRNPIKKVKAPKVPEEILEPVPLDDVWRMTDTCNSSPIGIRDRAILLTLLDTGVRAAELLAANVEDLEPLNGALTVQRGKGGKGRVVFAGQNTRRALRAWLKARGPIPGALFTNLQGERLKYQGLVSVLRRRAIAAGVQPSPMPHDFRRAFALAMLRGGANVLSIQRLLGHSDLSVLKRYIKQNAEDLRAAHAASSPVDRAGW
jgi:integrase/recombinase XerC